MMKDLKAVTTFSDAPLINNIIDYNQSCKTKYQKEGDNNGPDHD